MRTILVLLAALFLVPSDAVGQQRVALVIGNAGYTAVTPLANPLNDARGLAQLLRQELGFQVTTVADGSRREMVAALDRFARQADRAEVALFFYAGHALEVDGINYLLPVDAQIAHEREVETQAVSLGAVMARMEGAQVRVLLLDSCRDNPLAARMVRSRSTRGLSRGLAEVSNAPRGTLIAFATAPGEVAGDGAGANSPFSAALMQHLATPGEDIRVVMGAVADSVQAATRNQPRPQVPWQNSSLGGSRVVLKQAGLAPRAAPPLAAPQALAAPQPAAPQPRQHALALPPIAPRAGGAARPGFSCPRSGHQVRHAVDGGTVTTSYDGADPADPEVCISRVDAGPSTRLLFNFYPMPIASGEAVARREFGALLRGERTSASFVVGVPGSGGTRFFDDTWRRLPGETLVVNSRPIATAVFEVDRNGRFGVTFRGRIRLWLDPDSGLWLKRAATVWEGDRVPAYDAIAVGGP